MHAGLTSDEPSRDTRERSRRARKQARCSGSESARIDDTVYSIMYLCSVDGHRSARTEYVLRVGQNTVTDTTVESTQISSVVRHTSHHVGRESSVDGRPRRATRTRTRGLSFFSKAHIL